MNIQKLEALAQRLENWDKETYGRSFDMSGWIYKYAFDCKTHCCIAGDVLLHEGLYTKGMTSEVMCDAARSELGLSQEEADWLFNGDFSRKSLIDISPQLAAKAVRLLISEGSEAVMQMVSY